MQPRNENFEKRAFEKPVSYILYQNFTSYNIPRRATTSVFSHASDTFDNLITASYELLWARLQRYTLSYIKRLFSSQLSSIPQRPLPFLSYCLSGSPPPPKGAGVKQRLNFKPTSSCHASQVGGTSLFYSTTAIEESEMSWMNPT